MWLMSASEGGGFYSAVEHRDDESLLMIRCRVLSDAQYLAKKTGARVKKSNGLADYEYRVTITKSQYAAFVVGEILDINYDNFKHEVEKRQGKKRSTAYLRVWSALASLQPLRPYANVPLPPLPKSNSYVGPASSYVWSGTGPRGGVQTNWWSDEVEGGLARLEHEAADEDAWFCPECKLYFSDCPGHEPERPKTLSRKAQRRENKRRARGKEKTSAR